MAEEEFIAEIQVKILGQTSALHKITARIDLDAVPLLPGASVSLQRITATQAAMQRDQYIKEISRQIALTLTNVLQEAHHKRLKAEHKL